MKTYVSILCAISVICLTAGCACERKKTTEITTTVPGEEQVVQEVTVETTEVQEPNVEAEAPKA